MNAPRTLLLAADPPSAWRLWRAEQRWNGDILLASRFAAAAFGIEGRPRTLRARAERIVGRERIASRLEVRRSRLSAVRAEPSWSDLARRDANGYARIGTLAIGELLRHSEPGPPPEGLDARLERWWSIAQRHREQLATVDRIDPAELLREAARALARRATPASTTAFLGFLNLHHDQLELIDALAGPGSVVILPDAPPWSDAQSPTRRALLDRGFVEARLAAAPSGSVERIALTFPSREAEVAHAIADLKARLLSGEPPADVAIAVADMGSYAPPLEAAARAAGVPLQFERFVPVAETAAGAAAMLFLEAVQSAQQQEPEAETLLAWLAHPRVARLDAATLSQARREPPRSWRLWLELDPGLELLRWPTSATPEAWRTLLEGGWRRAGLAPRVDPATLAPLADGPEATAQNPDPFEDPHLREAWTEGLEALEALCDAANGSEVARDEVIATLREVLHAESVFLGASEPAASEQAAGEIDGLDEAPDPTSAAISVFDLTLIGSQRRRTLYLLGAVDGLTPRVLREDPILGFAERRQLIEAGIALPSVGDLGRAERLTFWGAAAAAQASLWIGLPEQIGRDSAQSSPFVELLGLEPQEAPPLPIASPDAFLSAALRHDALPDASEPRLAQARAAHALALRRETHLRWTLDDGLMGLAIDPESRTWSATALRELGSCRFRWWVQGFLGVRELEEAERTLTPILEGRLLHEALEHALRPAIGLQGEAARAAAVAALEGAFAEAEREVAVARVVQHWEKRRSEPLAHLRRLLDHPEMFPEGAVVVELEHKFKGSWRGWPIQGYVDRIDRTERGLRLTDYKLGSSTGAIVRDAELEPALDLQLPIYTEVGAADFSDGLEQVEARYMSLRKVKLLDAKPPSEEQIEDLLKRLRESLAAGFFPPEPNEKICRTCSQELICRKGTHLELKDPPYHPPRGEGRA